jgi:hypothetical protein
MDRKVANRTPVDWTMLRRQSLPMHPFPAFTALLLVFGCSLTARADSPSTQRQDDVRAKGAQVMPFALDKTVHIFDKTESGGVQRVVVRGETPDQVAMIRRHLSEIARAFTERDFTKPAHIHGSDMPGLAEMQHAGPGELEVRYRDLDDGAQITYVGHTPGVVDAVHRWFDAQLRDHGHDATARRSGPGLGVLAWLAGTWIIDDGGRHIEEIWTSPARDLMLGMSRTLRTDTTVSFEFMRIAARPDGVFYIAQPRGNPPVEFPLESWDGTQAVFLNPGNGDHLKRIVYRRNADGSLTARIEGANQGVDFAEEFPYHRARSARGD